MTTLTEIKRKLNIVQYVRLTLHEDYVTKYDNVRNPMYNKKLVTFRDNLVINWGVSLTRQGELLVAELRNLPFDKEHFRLIVKLHGGSVQGYDPMLKVHKDNIDDKVPTNISNANNHQTNDLHTWRTWRDECHLLNNPIKDYYYFNASSFGQTLTDKDLLLCDNATGVELFDLKEYQLLQEEQYAI